MSFAAASIDGSFECDGAHFLNAGGVALNLVGARLGKVLHLRRNFIAKGKCNLFGVQVVGHIDCENAKFENPGALAINAERAAMGSDVIVGRGFVAEGEVSFRRATIDGSLVCDGGTFKNQSGTALNCNAAIIRDGAFAREGFIAEGVVNFGAGRLRRLECDTGSISAPHTVALSCNGAEIEDVVFLRRGLKVSGDIDFTGCQMGALDASGGTFRKSDAAEGAVGFRLRRARIKGALAFADWRRKATLDDRWSMSADTVDLSGCHAGTLIDSSDAWRDTKSIILDGFTYDHIEDGPTNWLERLRWLNLQPQAHLKADFRPQPWRQLTKVLREMGHGDDATMIAIEKRNVQPASAAMGPLDTLAHWFLRHTCSYGYNPWLALAWSVWAIMFFALVLDIAHDNGGLVTAHMGTVSVNNRIGSDGKENAQQPFNAVLLSADIFLPIVDLQQEKDWQVAPSFIGGDLLRYFLFVESLVGVVLTSLVVASFAGWLRTD